MPFLFTSAFTVLEFRNILHVNFWVKKKMFPVLLLLLVVDSVKQTIHAHIPGFRVALDKSLILGAASYSDARVKTGVPSGERYWL